MNQEYCLNKRVALVTGGNGGLGLAMALALKEKGATVVVGGRDPQKLGQAKGLQLIPFPLNVTAEENVQEAVKFIEEQHGRLDILINNAGIYEDQQTVELTLNDWNRMISTNLTSSFLCSKYAIRLMKKQEQGKIINIGSMYSLYGHPKSIGYATSKTGILGLTRSLAAELGAWNIQVNAILPGWFETEINAGLPQSERGEEIRRKTPLARWGLPQDIGPLAVFLSSRGSDFITGAAIPIDGGYSISDRFLF